MAPEQIRGTPAISHKTDLYAMGVVFYQMLTGRAPFEGGSPVVLMHAHLSQSPPRPSAAVPEIPKALDDLVVKLMAKPPTDRPWDAAAVGVALADLRDKASRGDMAPMVVPTEGDTASPASSSSATPKTTATAQPTKTKSGRRFALPPLNRATLEVALLVLVLVACLGFVAYMLWPPSAAYLHRRAARLMESSRRADWIEARKSYIDPLDRDFPDHPYREQTRAWRDRILLDEAGERARRLESPVRTKFTEPQTTGEHEYVEAYALASEASGRGDDQAAIQYWEEMARRLKPDDAEQRPWSLLAQKRAEDVRKAIAERREIVIRQLNDAERARRLGEVQKALTIQANIMTHYGRYGDVADVLERAGLKPPQARPTPPTADPSLPEVPLR
jgi:serine/threonine-protein kinase